MKIDLQRFKLLAKGVYEKAYQAGISLLGKALNNPRRYVGYGVIGLLVFFALFSNYGLVTRIHLEYQKRHIESQIEEMKRREAELDSAISKASDLDEIEKAVRESYNFSLQGEIIYKIED